MTKRQVHVGNLQRTRVLFLTVIANDESGSYKFKEKMIKKQLYKGCLVFCNCRLLVVCNNSNALHLFIDMLAKKAK